MIADSYFVDLKVTAVFVHVPIVLHENVGRSCCANLYDDDS